MESKSLERLHNNEDFLVFMTEVENQREGWIAQLHDRPTETLQQISGRICALDDILNAAQHKSLKAKWNSIRQ
jgi:hypothetical protein